MLNYDAVGDALPSKLLREPLWSTQQSVPGNNRHTTRCVVNVYWYYVKTAFRTRLALRDQISVR